jgi:SapC protein
VSADKVNGRERRPADPALPLFFRRVQALDTTLHAALRIDRGKGFGYAAQTNALPLAGSEFMAAAACYPIVFAGSGPAAALAVTGSRDGQNLFIDGKGTWRPGAYVPAYVRSYPFLLLEMPGTDRLVLAIDPDAEQLGAESGQPLFADGKSTQTLDEVLQFCRALHDDLKQTRSFCEALETAGLLVANQAMLTLRSGAKHRLEGFKVIDRAKFDALDDATFLDWRKRGYLPLIYAHFVSTAQWAEIVELTAASEPKA